MSRYLIETAQDNSIRVNEGQRTARCILITEGLGNLRDKNLYLADAVESAVKVFEGAQCYLDHPSSIDEEARPERSVRDLCGWFSDCGMTTVRDANTGDKLAALVATLHFSDAEPGEIAYQQVRAALAYRKQFPDSKATYAGLSINAGGLSEEAEVPNLGTVNAVHEITDVFSCDLVTKPARGGTFLGLSESYKAPVREHGPVWLSRDVEAYFTNDRGALRAQDGSPIAHADKFVGFVEADASAGRIISDMADKVGSLIDQADEDPDLDGDEHGDLDELPMDSIQDDIERKQSVKRSMQQPEQDEEEADTPTPPPQRDAWEDEAEGGRRGQRRPSQGRSRHESVRHFEKTYEEAGVGDGMKSSDSWTSPTLGENPDGSVDDRASKEELNYRYSAVQGSAGIPARRCGSCVHFQPDDPANPEGGGGCEVLKGVVRYVDVCDAFEPQSEPKQAFDSAYEP